MKAIQKASTFPQLVSANGDIIAASAPNTLSATRQGRAGAPYFLHGDHLGSATLTTDINGNRVGELRYTPYGVTRHEWGNTPTNRRYTGQRWEASLGLYDYRARFYDPILGRFLQPDPVVPEVGNPQGLNRYAYVYNNPLRYADEGGNAPVVPLLVAGAVVLLKAIDYGWTAWDVYQSGRVLAHPLATDEEKLLAGANLALAVGLEVVEPEEWLPASLPLDDVGRRVLVAGLRERIQQGGLQAGVAFLREALGEATPQVIQHMYKLGVFQGVRSAGEWEAILKGVRKEAGLEVHHLIEQRFAKEVFGLKPADVPAVVLERTFHQQEVTARLFSRLPTNRAKFEPQEIWNVYKDVYGAFGHEDWLEAIWPYFARLGVEW